MNAQIRKVLTAPLPLESSPHPQPEGSLLLTSPKEVPYPGRLGTGLLIFFSFLFLSKFYAQCGAYHGA